MVQDAVTVSYETPVMLEAYKGMLDRMEQRAALPTSDRDTTRYFRSEIAAE